MSARLRRLRRRYLALSGRMRSPGLLAMLWTMGMRTVASIAFGFVFWFVISVGLLLALGVAVLYSPLVPLVVAQVMPQVKLHSVRGGICTGLQVDNIHLDWGGATQQNNMPPSTIEVQGLWLHIDCADYWQSAQKMLNQNPVHAWPTQLLKLPVHWLKVHADVVHGVRPSTKTTWPLHVPANIAWPFAFDVPQFTVGKLQWNALKWSELTGFIHIDNAKVSTQIDAKLYGAKGQTMLLELNGQTQLHMPYATQVSWVAPDHHGIIRASISEDSSQQLKPRLQIDEFKLQTHKPIMQGKGWFAMYDKGAFQASVELHNMNAAIHWQSICTALHAFNPNQIMADCSSGQVPKHWQTQLRGTAEAVGYLYAAGHAHGVLPDVQVSAAFTNSTWQNQTSKLQLLADARWDLSSTSAHHSLKPFGIAGLVVNDVDMLMDWGPHQASIQGNFGVPNAALHLQAQSPALGRFKKLSAKLQGDLWQHRFEAVLSGAAISTATSADMKFADLKLVLAGGLSRSNKQAYRWQGQLMQADVQQANASLPLLRLSKPADLQWGMQFVQLGQAHWLGQQGVQLESDVVQFDAQGLRVLGRAKALPVLDLARYMPQLESAFQTAKERGVVVQNLRWNADWSMKTKPWQPGVNAQRDALWSVLKHADVVVNIQQSQGSMTGPAIHNRIIELNALSVKAVLNKGVLDITSDVASRPWGQMQASMKLTLPETQAELLQAPLQASMNGSVDNIAPWAAFADLPVRLSGSVQLQMAIQGTLKQPQLQGTLAGNDLATVEWSQGIRLENGTVRANIDADGLQINQAHFDVYNRVVPRRRLSELGHLISGAGRVELQGRLNWPLASFSHVGSSAVEPQSASVQPKIPGRIQVVWRNTPGPARPDRLVWSSGQLTVMQPNHAQSAWQVDGAINVHGAYIEAVPEAQTRLSSDIVIQGAPSGTQGASIPVKATVKLNLGDHFYVQGKGLRTRLEGNLDVNARTDTQQRLTAYGTIELQDGVYRAYGQDLTITEGVVNVQGPLDNPGLRIRAMRLGQSVEAGVEVQGTLRRPKLSLVSEPAVPDAEKLSWLLLGRGSSVTGRDQAALISAFQALWADDDDEGVLKKLANRIGVDDLGLTTGSLTAADPKAVGSSVLAQSGFESAANVLAENDPLLAQRLLTVGKRLSDTLQISIDQSLNTAAHVLRLTMQLHRKLSLVVRAGADQAVDVLYQTSKP